ncbi:MAG: hypothetical protein WD556_11045 [Actinomycetota bacterium]
MQNEREPRTGSKNRRTAIVGMIALTLALGVGSAALAAVVTIDGSTDIEGATAIWNPYGYYDYDQCVADTGYMASEEGYYGAQSDTFDGGMMLVAGGDTYAIPSDEGDLTGKQVTTGPRNLGGLKVWRMDRALSMAPTMRSLVKLKNPTNKTISRAVIWDSALGADGDAAVRSSSVGDAKFTKGARWITASDSATDPSDPAAAFQFFGRGDVRSPVNEVLYRPAEDPVPGEACVTVKLGVKVPANSSRYLLFFTEQWGTNEEARMGIRQVDMLSENFYLNDIGPGVRRNILNWDLG